MALYPPAVKQLIPPPSNDPKIKARVVILHVAASNATSLHDYFNGPSGGVESHFYVLKDGTVQQYRDTAYQADANMAANDFAISIETQGLAAGTWTDAQLASIKALLLWCHTTHGIPLVKCPTWDGSGVGYHVLFEAQWDGRNASCPGPDRIKQFDNVLVPWMAAGGQEADVPLTDDDAAKVWLHGQDVQSAWSRLVAAQTTAAAAAKDASAALALAKTTAAKVDAMSVDAVAAAVVAKLPAGSVDVPTLAKAVVNEMASRPLVLGKVQA